MKVTKLTAGKTVIKDITFEYNVPKEVSNAVGKYIGDTFKDVFRIEGTQKPVKKDAPKKDTKSK